ncbi:unnamed protein product [Linum trigynum]|uniref:Uncharacterized protein n=1 Tax=Linum trigynum TaxID=586398 RepID=A0AAV2DBA1_9ROSI
MAASKVAQVPCPHMQQRLWRLTTYDALPLHLGIRKGMVGERGKGLGESNHLGLCTGMVGKRGKGDGYGGPIIATPAIAYGDESSPWYWCCRQSMEKRTRRSYCRRPHPIRRFPSSPPSPILFPSTETSPLRGTSSPPLAAADLP